MTKTEQNKFKQILDGKQVELLFNAYLPNELSDQLKNHDEPIDLTLTDATVKDLISELDEMMRGVHFR